MSDLEEEVRVVRRVVRHTMVLGALVAVFFAARADFRALGILTLTVVLSIVHFRGLQAQVRVLDPHRGAESRARNLVIALTRYLLLAAGLLFLLLVDPSRPAALVIGVSTLPAALMLEAVFQAVETRSSRIS